MVLRFFLVAIFAVYYTATMLRDYQMFQLSSYKTREYIRWLRRNLMEYVKYHVFIYVLLFLTCITEIGDLPLAVDWLFLKWPWNAKKPLVYTPRVFRMLVTHVFILLLPVTWSFSVSYFYQFLFLALLILLSPLTVILSNLLNSPIERAINNRYIADAKRILSEMPRLTVIGVTGSYGKTSTKYFLTKLLSSKYNTLMTPESYNTPMGVVKTIRTQLKPIHDVFVCEMGARNVGDIKEICDIVRPRHGIITAIGEQHLETFKTVDNIVKTKFELADAVARACASGNGGTVFLNCDSEIIKNKNYGKPKVTYSASDEGGACDYTASGISVSSAGSSFRVAFPDGESRTFETPLIGKHNVQNITGAIAAADYLGVERDDMAVSVRRLEPVPHRLQLIKRNSIIIIDDAYNSNPSGARAALDTLGMFDGLKIMVTPGMVELGSAQDASNKQFGAEAAAVCDYVILVGERQTRSILEGLRGEAFPDRWIKVVGTLEAAFAEIEKIDSYGRQKVVLLENDLPDNY